jgi:hypothetical protein
MESKSTLNVHDAIANVRRHFDFLFRRGFRIASVLSVDPGNEQWLVVLTAGNYLIQFVGHEDRVSLALSSQELCTEFGFIELHELIYLLEREGNSSHIPKPFPLDEFREFTTMAELLETYMDDIWLLIDRINRVVSKNKARAIDLNNCPGFYRLSHK